MAIDECLLEKSPRIYGLCATGISTWSLGICVVLDFVFNKLLVYATWTKHMINMNISLDFMDIEYESQPGFLYP